MNLRRAAGPAALLALLLCSGCAMLAPGPGAPAAESAAPAGMGTAPSAAAEQQTSTLGVNVEIVAPPPLRELLERHLDLVRLGSMTRVDIDDTEWSRLIDATPAQVAELLQTEGYFKPQVTLGRAPGRAAGQPDIVRLEVDPGPRARISRVTIEAQGDLERDAAAGEAHAVATLAALRQKWQLPVGQAFRNPDWNGAKSAALAELRAAGYANATWAGSGAEIDVANNEVRLFLVAESGPLFRFGELQIEGLVAHDAQTVAHLADKDPRDVVLDLVQQHGISIAAIYFGKTEADLRDAAAWPYSVVGSDGLLFANRVENHPRTFGTFPRYLRKYVREQHLFSLEEAVRRMSGLTAEILRLSDRGCIAQGRKADLLLIDPARITDQGTYEEPDLPPLGIELVMVNGRIVRSDAADHPGASGQVLGMPPAGGGRSP